MQITAYNMREGVEVFKNFMKILTSGHLIAAGNDHAIPLEEREGEVEI